MPRGKSDHVPICFRSANKFDWGPKPFRSVDAWWEHDDFDNFVKESWNSVCSSSNNLTQRLRELRTRIKNWNANIFGDQNKKIKDLNCAILAKEVAADYRQLSVEEESDLAILKNELWVSEKRIESLWIQKSRLNWSLSGDRNTKFFHSIASQHHRNNHISSIQVEDSLFAEPADIRFHI
ncbi:uncharacterized protein LOC126686057 [Mercurialis annua]|uniref:uncharacterized protein LOC126686057 n=1 Tax=Mercurialis annua TaxID=3986 RepID=UPI00215EB26C|nr:uncharacterized protein LOC126686057 [Mercurialis annua]